MHHVPRFYAGVDQAHGGNPIDGIGLKSLGVQRVWG
jgi:hypothetical protein